MSLVAWYPLNGTLENRVDRAFGNLSNTNSSVNSVTQDGKLGSTYTNTSNTSGSLLSDSTFNLGQNQSMFCWLYMTSVFNSSNLNAIMGQHRYAYNSSKGINMGLTVKYASATTGYLSVNTATSSGRTYVTYLGSTLLQTNTWYHVGYTYDGSIIRLYVNGELDGEHAFTGQLFADDYFGAYMWSLSGATIGTKAAHNNYVMKGKLNDIRIYNHTLSAGEIREISKGLMVHYDFNDPHIETTTNYAAINDWSSYGSYWTITEKTSTGLKLSRPSSSSNTVLALSNSTLFANMTAGDTWTFSGYLYVNGMPYKSNCTQISTYGGYSEAKVESREDGYFRATFNLLNKDSGWIFHASIFDSIAVDVPCEIRYMQFEKKDHPTAYTPDSREGFISSGSLNNNTTCNNLTTSSDTILGTNCAVFDGSSSYVEFGFIKTNLVSSDWTINFWVYSEDNNSSERFIFVGDYGLTDGTKFNIEKGANGQLRLWFNGGSFSNYYSGCVIPYQEWCMITVAYTPGTVKIYKNGSYITSASVAISSTKSSGGLRIGRDNRTDITCFKGKMADFRMYATSLSDTLVAEEYKIKKKFYKNGLVCSNVFIEDGKESSGFTKKGVSHCNGLIETIEKDGETWVQVMHHNNHSGKNLFSSSDNFASKFVYHNEDCWSAFHLITKYGAFGSGELEAKTASYSVNATYVGNPTGIAPIYSWEGISASKTIDANAHSITVMYNRYINIGGNSTAVPTIFSNYTYNSATGVITFDVSSLDTSLSSVTFNITYSIGEGTSYHFMCMDEFYDGSFKIQQWSQNTNPVTSTDTPTILSGSCTFGGLRKNGTNTFMSRPSNWWAATGCWTQFTGGGVTGIPGYYDQSHACSGSMDLFVKVNGFNEWYREFPKGITFATEYNEAN